VIYTHRLGGRILQSQGNIPPSGRGRGSFVSLYQEGKRIDGYLYLRYTDITVDRVLIEYPDIFAMKNKVYTTGMSQVYR